MSVTPTTTSIRSIYARHGAGTDVQFQEGKDRFDIWLAEHDEEIRKHAHEEGFIEGVNYEMGGNK